MFDRNTQGAVEVVRGHDPLVSDHLEQLSDLLEEYLEQGQPRVVLDMQDTPLIDSAGLELLLDAQANFQGRGGALKLAGLRPLCDEILTSTGVGDYLETFSDVNTAVGSFLK